MSSSSYSEDCPVCTTKDSLMRCDSNRPISYSGECLACGWSFYTKYEQLTLEDVNELRMDIHDLEPLKELVEQED